MDPGTVLLTGGSGGIGRAIVRTLTSSGVRVAFTWRQDESGARALVDETKGAARAFRFDVRDPAAAEALVREIEQDVGPLRGLVNNAGVRKDSLLANTTDSAWDEVLDINLGGAFRCCRAVLPWMVSRRAGAIVNVGSLSGLHGVPGQSAYAASKAGLLGLTRALAREVGRKGVRVNAVVPGFVATGLVASVPAEAVAALRATECLPGGVDARSVAETVAFLLSDKASSITGQMIVVDAGSSA